MLADIQLEDSARRRTQYIWACGGRHIWTIRFRGWFG